MLGPLRFLLTAFLFFFCLAAGPTYADPPPGTSGQPVPRYVSTRSNVVNVRAGPGERYPVQWVLRRKGMPVEVTAEYENWRKIRDWLGTEGWVNQALLSGRRVVVIYPADVVLRTHPDPIARPVARLQQGVLARLSRCETDWCAVKIGYDDGWVSKTSLWGVSADEVAEW